MNRINVICLGVRDIVKARAFEKSPSRRRRYPGAGTAAIFRIWMGITGKIGDGIPIFASTGLGAFSLGAGLFGDMLPKNPRASCRPPECGETDSRDITEMAVVCHFGYVPESW